MNLKIYGAHKWTLGGGEKYLCCLAEALSQEHQVTILADGVSKSLLETRFNVDLGGVKTGSGSGRDADIIQSNEASFGRKLAYVIQIPYGPINLWSIGRKVLSAHLRDAREDVRRKNLLHDARRSDLVLVYSEFVRDVLKCHGINATVLYPPVDDFASDNPKKKVILSVGRFFERQVYNVKRYDALIEAFKLFYKEKPDWEYRIVGGATDGAYEHIENLRSQAKGYPISFHMNVSREELKQHYGEAMIFWHGAGFEGKRPENLEHFGISTLEAMSAGCVPFVVQNGGQEEILRGHDAGYFWNTIQELARASAELVAVPVYCNPFQETGRARYQDFTKARFTERALSIFQQWEDK
jgi:glycosyltransferase involved in cell wall biosynthesis